MNIVDYFDADKMMVNPGKFQALIIEKKGDTIQTGK